VGDGGTQFSFSKISSTPSRNWTPITYRRDTYLPTYLPNHRYLLLCSATTTTSLIGRVTVGVDDRYRYRDSPLFYPGLCSENARTGHRNTHCVLRSLAAVRGHPAFRDDTRDIRYPIFIIDYTGPPVLNVEISKITTRARLSGVRVYENFPSGSTIPDSRRRHFNLYLKYRTE